MATTKKEATVAIKPIEMATVTITIEGDSPLIEHAWSEKAKRMMLETQTGKAKGKAKEKRSPIRDFINSLYWKSGKPEITDDMSEEECQEAYLKALEHATFGFPLTGIKQAGNSAAFRMHWVKDQMGLRGNYFIKDVDGDGLLKIDGVPTMREDTVKLQGKTADLRYRGEFKDWSITFDVEYNVNSEFSLENLLNIINAGGTVCGIGEWRPERDGQFGRYHIKTK